MTTSPLGEAPVLLTERLRLRRYEAADTAAIRRLASDREIADTTANIPHPYGDGDAQAAIERAAEAWRRGEALALAITDRADGTFFGSMSLKVNRAHDSAELGYWIGVPYWGRGYASEAARAVVAHGFEKLGLHRIEAFCMTGNPASARILEKLGMRQEGLQRDGLKKWGAYRDVALWAVLRTDLDSFQ